MIVSVPLVLEYEVVLTRPEHLSVIKLRAKEGGKIIDAVAAVSSHARLSFRWRPLLDDANDDMVLETAINGGAELLVTFNIRDFGSVSDKFGCLTVLPREAVDLVRNKRLQ